MVMEVVDLATVLHLIKTIIVLLIYISYYLLFSYGWGPVT